MKQLNLRLLVTFLAAAVSLVSAGLSTPLYAQTFYGSVVGTVTDTTGAVVSGAAVTITDLATNESRTTQTNGAGEYSFVNLVPANYRVVVVATTFKRFERNPVEVAVNTASRVNAALQVGAATETVEVSTNAPLLQTESGSLGDEVSAKQVEDMPLNGRNTMNLMELVPGVVPQGNTLSGVAMNQGTGTGSVAWGNYQIGGGMPTQSSIFIDGSPTMLMQKNSSGLVPTADTVQEFQVQTSGVSPEFGRFGGGIVSMTTKSGSNAFHGTAYEYIRNKDVNANLFFNNRNGLARGEATQNQFGGTVGGPIWKNKAFFFFAYEQIHIRQQNIASTNIPSPLLQAGVFADAVAGGGYKQITDPLGACNFQQTATGGTVNGVSGVPAGAWYITNLYGPALANSYGITTCGDPTAKVMAKFYPSTTKNPNAVDNYNTAYSQGDDGSQMSGRVDYDITHNQRFFARFTLWPLNDESPDVMGTNNGFNTTGNGSHNHTNNLVTGDTITLTPTTVLDIRADYLRQYGDSVPPVIGTVNESTFGAPFAALAQYMNYKDFPQWSLAGTSQIHNIFNFGFGGVDKMWYNNYHLSGAITKIVGKHSLKFGAEGRLMQRDDLGTGNSGSFTFGADIAGDEWAQFLMGEFDTDSFTNAKATTTFNWYTGYYVADTWQVNQKLTMSFGLRVETPGSYAEAKNNLSVLLPNTTDPVTGIYGTAGLVNSSLYVPRFTLDQVSAQFGPRFGFAYRLTNTTVFRGGYTLSYLPRDTQTGEFAVNQPINSAATTNTNTPTSIKVTPFLMGINPFPPTVALPNGVQLAPGRSNPSFMVANIGQSVSFPYSHEHAPYAEEMNVSVGHQLKGDTLIDLGFAHMAGTHLPTISQGLDELPDQYDSMGATLATALTGSSKLTYDAVSLPSALQTTGQTLRPYPAYKNYSNSAAYYSTSSYNALEVKVQKRFHSTGQIGGAYTWMKMITDTDSFLSSQDPGGEGAYQDYNNPKAERSLYSSDVPNRLAINYLLNLPFGQGQRFGAGANPVVSRAISGWALSGITTLQSGLPIHLTTSGNNLSKNFGAGTIRPNYNPTNTNAAPAGNTPGSCSSTKTVGGSGYTRTLTGNVWFNTTCFTPPITPGSLAVGTTAQAGTSYAFGNEPRVDDAMKVSGVDNFDFSIDKTTAIHEQVALKFTVEFFNIFNRVQFGPPQVAADNSQFGQVTTQQNFPRIVQGALRLNF